MRELTKYELERVAGGDIHYIVNVDESSKEDLSRALLVTSGAILGLTGAMVGFTVTHNQGPFSQATATLTGAGFGALAIPYGIYQIGNAIYHGLVYSYEKMGIL